MYFLAKRAGEGRSIHTASVQRPRVVVLRSCATREVLDSLLQGVECVLFLPADDLHRLLARAGILVFLARYADSRHRPHREDGPTFTV